MAFVVSDGDNATYWHDAAGHALAACIAVEHVDQVARLIAADDTGRTPQPLPPIT